jgi:hypothetical protein
MQRVVHCQPALHYAGCTCSIATSHITKFRDSVLQVLSRSCFPSSTLFHFLIKFYLSHFFYSSPPLRTTYYVLPSPLNYSIYYFIPISPIPCPLSPVLFTFLVPFLFLSLPSVFTSVHKTDRSFWLVPWHQVVSQHCYTCARLHGVTSRKILSTANSLPQIATFFPQVLLCRYGSAILMPNCVTSTCILSIHDKTAGIVTTPRVGRSRNAGSILGRGESIFLSPKFQTAVER